jgi:hypothetical protein
MTAAEDHARRAAKVLLAGLAAALLIALAVLLLAGGSRHPTRAKASAHPLAAATPREKASRRERHAPLATRDPGSLPQTHAFPPASSPHLKAAIASLWAAVVAGSPGRGRSAFFPEAAYVKLKAIGSASSDWSGRLLHEYALDIAAAHASLGPGAARASLIGVDVPERFGHWVEVGVCYNSIGYWELPNARVVFLEDGKVRSFGIASMISWRGEWYVVHLGAVLRSGDGGVVDEPSAGRGSSAYSSTC